MTGTSIYALLENDGAEVRALGNQYPDSLSQLAEQLGSEQVCSDFEKIAKDEVLEAVVVGLPNYLHAPVAIQMLEAGRHVLCEKTMAMTAEEAGPMIACCARRNRIRTESWEYGQWFFLIPSMNQSIPGAVFL